MYPKDLSSRVVLALCVGAFCLSMGLREVINVWVGTGAAAVVSLLLLRRLPGPGFGSMMGTSRTAVILGLAVGVATSVATWVLYPLSVDLVPRLQAEVPKLYALLRQPPGPVWALPVLITVVTAEELVWRGLAIDVFSGSGRMTRGVLFASLLYTLPQVAFRSPLLVVVSFFCGLIWGILRVRTGGLAAPLIAHIVWDLLVFVWFPVE